MGRTSRSALRRKRKKPRTRLRPRATAVLQYHSPPSVARSLDRLFEKDGDLLLLPVGWSGVPTASWRPHLQVRQCQLGRDESGQCCAPPSGTESPVGRAHQETAGDANRKRRELTASLRGVGLILAKTCSCKRQR